MKGEESNSITSEPILKRRRARRKNAAPQKRYVVAVKVFMTPEEKRQIESRVGDFKSLSNLIRHHLGLNLNSTGRRKNLSEEENVSGKAFSLGDISDSDIDALIKSGLG